MHTLGIIVAGGASRRMRLADGRSKAAVEVGGQTLLERVCRAVRPEVERLVVVAGPDQPVPPGAAIDGVVHDSLPGAGPLAGIADALRAAGPAEGVAFVGSCDVPLLRREVVRLVLGRARQADALWAVPLVADHPQVLVSALKTAILPEIEAWLSSGRRDLQGLRAHLQHTGRVATITAAEIQAVDPHGESFADADTPADLARIAAILPRLPPSRH